MTLEVLLLLFYFFFHKLSEEGSEVSRLRAAVIVVDAMSVIAAHGGVCVCGQ